MPYYQHVSVLLWIPVGILLQVVIPKTPDWHISYIGVVEFRVRQEAGVRRQESIPVPKRSCLESSIMESHRLLCPKLLIGLEGKFGDASASAFRAGEQVCAARSKALC